jgi:hypothetical protein
MRVPAFLNNTFVDENGDLTPGWSFLLNQLFNDMQANISNEGFVIPSQTTVNINKLANVSPKIANGTMLYDSDLNVLKVFKNGVFKTITTN